MPNVLFTSFRFTSLLRIYPISPVTTTKVGNSHRLVTKQSYLLFAWLRYLMVLRSTKVRQQPVQITVLPATNAFYTVTKAPMAHKTRSKEQLLFKFYHFVTTFKTQQFRYTCASRVYQPVNQLAYILWATRKLFPFFETNLLFLKYYRVQYPLQDKHYFNLTRLKRLSA